MNNTFAKNFKCFRKMRYSQEQMAEIFHVEHTTISNWENGKFEPSIDILIKIANMMDVSLDELVGREFEYREPQKPKQNNLL